MPTYRITDPETNKTIRITGDSPPSEKELEQIFSKTRTQTGGRNLLKMLGKIAGVGYAPQAVEKGADIFFGRTKKYITEDVPEYYKKKMPKTYQEQLKEQAEIAPEALAAAGEIGAWTMPVSKAAKGAGFLPKVWAGTKTGAKIGALLGLTAESESLEERLEKGAKGLAVGGATGAVTTGMFEAGKGMISWLKKAPRKIKIAASNQLLGMRPNEIRVTKQGENWLSTQLVDKLDDGTIKPGNYVELRKQSQSLLNKSEKKLKPALEKVDDTTTLKQIMEPIDDLIKAAKKQGNKSKADSLIKLRKELYKQWIGNLNATQINQLKREMYKALSDSRFSQQADEIVAARASGQRAIGSSARKWLKGKAKEAAKLVDDEAVYINLMNAIDNQLKRMGTAPLTRTGRIPSIISRALTSPLRSPTTLSTIARMLPGKMPYKPKKIIGTKSAKNIMPLINKLATLATSQAATRAD